MERPLWIDLAASGILASCTKGRFSRGLIFRPLRKSLSRGNEGEVRKILRGAGNRGTGWVFAKLHIRWQSSVGSFWLHSNRTQYGALRRRLRIGFEAQPTRVPEYFGSSGVLGNLEEQRRDPSQEDPCGEQESISLAFHGIHECGPK